MKALTSAVTLGLLAVLTWVSAGAEAHEFDVKHRAIVTVRHTTDTRLTSAEVILLMEIPPGTRASRLRVQYDLDRDGTLSRAEALLLAGELGSEAVGGYVLRQDDKARAPVGIKSSALFVEDGGVAVAVLLDYKLASVATQRSKIGVDILATPGGGAPLRSMPVSLEIQVVGVEVATSSHPLARDARVLGPVELLPGAPGAWVEVSGKP